MCRSQERYGEQLGKTERKVHKLKRKDRHGTFSALSETLASSAFTIQPPINPIPQAHHMKEKPHTGNRTATRKSSSSSAMGIKNP
jgi:hypothetical protein